MDPVEQLMAACLDRPPAEWASAIEAACRDNPAHAAELHERMSVIAQLGDGAFAAGEAPVPEELGDFRLHERIGGGGMGVVYRARQRSLGRDVALKLIRPDLLWFGSTRERFRRETEAIARLSHPGIVSIHSVGEEHGVPFFAMELLAGATLAEVLRRVAGRAADTLTGRDLWEAVLVPGQVTAELPEIFRGGWTEACLALAVQVARSLEHAHARGLLHRDVKPSNIMVQADGRAVLLDFGLTSSAESAGERMTRTGAAIGTLVYMSVEQLEGRRELDARADVYSAGVTLYELLTLQAPFDGDSEPQIRASILQGTCIPVRARNRRVSEDAQTVCAKAMSRALSDRYETAADLARDLEAVLARRPIAARPPGVSRRLLRWVQRRPIEATAAGLALAATFGIPAGMLWVEARNAREIEASLASERAARREADSSRAELAAALEAEREAVQAADSLRAEAETQAAEAELQRVAAETARDLALQASETQNDVMQFLVDVLRGAYPGYHGGREPTIDEMLAFAAKDAEERLADRPHSLARIEMTLGIVHRSLSNRDRAAAHLDTAIERLDALPPTESVRRDLAQTLLASGSTQFHRGDPERGERELRRALALAEEIHAPDDPRLYKHYAELAELFQFQNRHPECIEVRRRALAHVEQYLPDDALLIAKAQLSLGFSLFMDKRTLEGEPLIEDGLAGLRAHADPLDKDFVQGLLRASKVPKSKGDFEAAKGLLREGLEKARPLWGATSDAVLGGEAELISHDLYQGNLEAGIDAYEPWLERAASVLQPTNSTLISGQLNYTTALYRVGRYAELIEYHERTGYLVPMRKALGATAPQLIHHTQQLADAFMTESRLEEGIDTLDDLIEILEQVPRMRSDLIIQLFTSQAMRREALQDFGGARKALERMVELAGDGPVSLRLEAETSPAEEVGVRALTELVALGEEQGWSDEVAGWREALVARRKRLELD